MPPPPLRCSPARETKIEQHKRGFSLESMLQDRDRDKDRDRDDDLALFQDMQTKERDNFLHPSADDIDDSLSMKLRGFLDIRLSISTPVRGESSDLLTTDADKNDYDWLLTPPDTPLFPSLDQETPVVNLSQRGRPRSQPICISRASRTELSSRAGRSSASPRRSSPSSCSSSINTYSRGRASSAPSASVSPTLRPLTPSGRPSTPTAKSSAPSARSSTPTLRRSSTGSNGLVGRGGPSSGKVSRGSSSSPKLQSWHSNIPGFTAEPPPNLRTTISDRPMSHVRGSSPARRGGEIGHGSRRQSVSPTVSRSASSSNSHDRDHFSSQSKGSAISSCEDEIDSVQSVFSGKKRTSTVGMVGRQVTRKQETYPNSRVQSLSKKPTRSTSIINVSGGSAPKRSFDSALRQMDRRNSQSMFRPLLSSAPATSFYASKANSLQRRTNSMNSSVTTSSNASSEQGASVAPYTEGSDHDHDDLGSEWEKSLFPLVQEEIFVFDKGAVKNEDTGGHLTGCGRQQSENHECVGLKNISGAADIQLDAHRDCDGCDTCEIKSRDSGNWDHGKMLVDISMKSLPGAIDDCRSDCCQNDFVGYTQQDDNTPGTIEDRAAYLDSQRKETALNGRHELADSSFVDIQEDVPANNPNVDKGRDSTWEYLQAALLKDLETENMQKLNYNPSQELIVQETTEKKNIQGVSIPLQHSIECESRCLQDCSIVQSAGVIAQKGAAHNATDTNWLDAMSKLKRAESFTHCHGRDDNQHITGVPSQDMPGKVASDCKLELSHVSAASMGLLSRAASGKWPVLQTKAANATDLPGEDPQLRGSLNEFMNYIRHEDNACASQAADVGSTKLTGISVLRQLSSRKLDIENFTSGSNIRVPSGMSTPTVGVQSDVHQSPVHCENAVMEHHADSSIDVFETTSSMKIGLAEGIAAEAPTDALQGGGSEILIGKGFVSISPDSVLALQEKSLVAEMDAKMKDALALEAMSQERSCPLNDVSNLETHDQIYASTESCDLSENARYSCSDKDGDVTNHTVAQHPDQEKGSTDCSVLASSDVVVSNEDNIIQEKKVDDMHESNTNSQMEAEPSLVDQSYMETDMELSASAILEEDNRAKDLDTQHPDPDCDKPEQVHVSEEEHTVKPDTSRGYLSRSLTLEEATDTILFCSSIVHSLAYKAATIGMEKENLIHVALPKPTINMLGMSQADHRNSCGGAAARRTSKFQKIKSRQTASHLQTPSNNVETNVKDQESVMHVVSIPERGDSVKPPEDLNPELQHGNSTTLPTNQAYSSRGPRTSITQEARSPFPIYVLTELVGPLAARGMWASVLCLESNKQSQMVRMESCSWTNLLKADDAA